MTMKLTVEVKGNGFNALKNLATDFKVHLAKETAIATRNTSKAHRREISRNVRKYVQMTNKGVLEVVELTKSGTKDSPNSEITIHKERRPSLKRFKPRQTKKGVSYKIQKGGKRKLIRGAFVSAQLAGHVYARTGKERKPIIKILGVSVAAVFDKNDLIRFSRQQILDRMEIEMQKRVRSIIVRTIKRQGRSEGLSTEQINQRIKRRFAA